MELACLFGDWLHGVVLWWVWFCPVRVKKSPIAAGSRPILSGSSWVEFQCGLLARFDVFSVQLTGGIVRSNLELNTDDLGVRQRQCSPVRLTGLDFSPCRRCGTTSPRTEGGPWFLPRCVRPGAVHPTDDDHQFREGSSAYGGGRGRRHRWTIRHQRARRGDLFLGPQVKSTRTTFGEHFVYAEGVVAEVHFGMNFCFQP